MARTETLELLAKVIDNLDGLDDTARGDPIRSGDWNTVVDAITTLAKLVSSREDTLNDQLEAGFAPLGHTHRGEVSLSWFDPATRKLLEGATTGTADFRLSFTKIERQVSGLNDAVKELRGEVDDLRASIEGVKDADFARARSVSKLSLDIETLRDLELGVDGLSERLTGLDGSISTVLEFRDALEDQAGTVEIGSLQERIFELEDLRGNLVLADGKLVEMRSIEAQLARLETAAVSRDEIDGLIVERVNDGSIFDDASFLAGVSAQVEETLDPRFAALEADGKARDDTIIGLANALEPVEDRLEIAEKGLLDHGAQLEAIGPLAERVGKTEDTLGRLEGDLGSISPRLDEIDALGIGQKENTARLDGLTATVELAATNAVAIGALGSRADMLEASFGETAGLADRVKELEAQTASIEPLDGRMKEVEAQAADHADRLELTEAELGTLAKTNDRLDAIEKDTESLNAWRTNTNQRLDDLASGRGGALESRVVVLEGSMAEQHATLKQLNARVDPLLKTQTNRLVVRDGAPFPTRNP